MSENDERRPYKSTVRRDQARRTRARIVDAARECFVAQGYAGTSVRQVAERAGVSEQTVYATFGNKSGLIRGMLAGLREQAGADAVLSDQGKARGNPALQLSLHIQFDRRLFERGGDTLRVLRDAASSDYEMAAAYRAARANAHSLHLRMFEEWHAAGVLQDGLTPVRASDIFHAYSSIDTFTYLVEERGWTPDEWQSHTEGILASTLIHPARREKL